MISELTCFQQKYKWYFFALLVLMTGFALYFALQLEIEPSFSVLISDDSEFNTNARLLETTFGTNDAVLIAIRINDEYSFPDSRVDLSGEDVSLYIENLRDILLKNEYVVSVSNVRYSEDMRFAELAASLSVPNYVGAFGDVLTSIDLTLDYAGKPAGVVVDVTGLPVLLDRVSLLLIQDNLRTILITIVLIFLVLLWYFKNFTVAFISTLAPIIGLIFLAAAMSILGIPITLTLAAVGVISLGLGADYSIHVAVHYKHKRQEGMNSVDAIVETATELWRPITASFLTTLGGFSALILGVSPSSQAQGIVLSLSIFIIYIVALAVYPLLLGLFAGNITFTQNSFFVYMRGVFTRIALFQVRRPKTAVFVIGIITIIMMYGASNVAFSTSNSNWIPDDDPVAESFTERSFILGDSQSITLIVQSTQGDLRTYETILELQELARSIEMYPTVDEVVSPFTGLSGSTASFRAITDERASAFSDDFTITTLQVRSQNFGQDDSGSSLFLDELRSLIEFHNPSYADITLFGDIVRFSELGDSLQQDAAITTMIGLLLVFFSAAVIYASFTVGFIALLPIIIAVIWTVGLMGFFNVPFTSLSTGIISLVLGIGVDFSIHITDGIKKRLARGKDLFESVNYSLQTSGSAVFLASLTTFFGFFALTFAQLLGTQRLGWSLSFSIISVFIVTICLVPAIYSITYNRSQKHLRAKQDLKNDSAKDMKSPKKKMKRNSIAKSRKKSSSRRS
ncbi:MAG: efflux RND transporter permease subunit [Candidatus Woesearchaeota archaeon]